MPDGAELRRQGTTVPNIILQLRSKLVKDSLSLVLMAAGFSVLPESDRQNDHVTVICGLDDYGGLPVHDAQDSAKIVILASEVESLAMRPEQIAPLAGVLTYGSPVDAFVRSLWRICSGERVFPCDVALHRTSPLRPPDTQPRPGGARLSPRDREVLCHLARGNSNRVIARHLDMSEATVKVHVQSLMRKTNVDNRTQVAIWAWANLPELGNAPHGFV